MLKLNKPDPFETFKCAEIFCIAAAAFEVSCCLCGNKMQLEQFPGHFQDEHYTLAENSIDLDLDMEISLQSEYKVIEHIPSPNETLTIEIVRQVCEMEDVPVELENVLETETVFIDDTMKIQDKNNKLRKKFNKKNTKHRGKLKEHGIATRKQLQRNAKSNMVKQVCEVDAPAKLENFLEAETVIIDDTKITQDNKIIINVLNVNETKHRVRKLKQFEVATRQQLLRNAKKSINGVDEKMDEEIMSEKEITSPTFESKTLKENEIQAKPCSDDNEVNAINDFHNDVDKPWSEEEAVSSNNSNSETNDNDELPYPCFICKRNYRSQNSLRQHKYTVHNPNKTPPKNSKIPKPELKCDECDEMFRTETDLRVHKYKHTGISCDICGKTFSQVSNMRTHKIRHAGVRNYKCKECSKEFFTAKELKQHMISHTGKMPLICELCGRGFRDRAVLKAHMRRHTGERPAKCDVCGKCFFSGHDLNVHAVTHTTDRPFECDICGSTFQRKKSLRIHKLTHSKDRKHVCKVCGKGFNQSNGLNSHLRSHDAAIEKKSDINS